MPAITTATELGTTSVVTQDGVITATLVDRVGPDRIMQMLMRGFSSAKYGGVTDNTARVAPELRSLLVNPKTEDGD
tara:strand:- start:149 stop:376 length:228 start_codon:yes stop_codon:yes gene_type:complete